VQIEDVTDSFALFHMTRPPTAALASADVTAKAERFGSSGIDVWLPRERHDAALQELSMSLPTCDADCAEVLRIERGIPRWGRELTDEIIPTEANLEASAIDYAKGCYIGQEVISRMKMSGQTNKRLCGLLAADNAAITAGMRLFADAKDVGWVTSVAQSARLDRTIALGFVKRGFQAPGTRLELHPGDGTTSSGMHVQVAPLPFV
jgi:folate-binding protein YgfZ